MGCSLAIRCDCVKNAWRVRRLVKPPFSAFCLSTQHPVVKITGMSLIIQSNRLDLVTFSPPFLRASLDGDLSRAETILEISLPAGWPTCAEPGCPDFRDVLALRLQQLDEDPTDQPWLLRAIVPRGSRVMAGYIGFHTSPGPEYLEPYSPGAVDMRPNAFEP